MNLEIQDALPMTRDPAVRSGTLLARPVNNQTNMTTIEYTRKARICEIESVDNAHRIGDIFGAVKWAEQCECNARMAAMNARDYPDHRNAEHALGLAKRAWRIISRNTPEKSEHGRRAAARLHVLQYEIEREQELTRKHHALVPAC